jgi:PAS domain S-box-containing protein
MTEKTKLLLVDDVPGLLLLTTTILEPEGYEIVTAATGGEGLLKARTNRPDMILLDVELPDVNGLEVCRRIKSDPDLEGTLVVIVSGRWTAADHQNEGLRAGADGYITRPFEREDFLARIEAFARLARAEKRLRQANRQLERQVEKRTAELPETLAQLRGEITKLKLTEEALNQTSSLLQNTFDAVPDLLTVHDRNLRVILSNWRDREDINEEERRSLPYCYACYMLRDTPCEPCPTLEVFHTGHAVRMEMRNPYTHRTLEVRAYPVLKASGDFELVTEHVRDITETKQAEEALRQAHADLQQRVAEQTKELRQEIEERKRAEETVRLAYAYNRSLIEASIDPLMTIGPDGRITDVNRAAERITGCSRDELIGTDFSDYFTEPDQARTGYQMVFLDGEVRDYELSLRHADGHVTPVLCNATVYRDETGRVIGVFAAARDITERKQVEEALLLAREAAESANLAKSAFLANMSHEIRTPLNAILGFSQLLQRDPALTHEQKGYLDTVSRSGEHLLTLINDILEMSKIEAGRTRLSLADSDFYALLKDVEAMIRVHAEEKGLMFQVTHIEPVPRYFHADSGKTRQVLMNLLGNAIKFTENGGITVQVRSEQAWAGDGDAGTRGHEDEGEKEGRGELSQHFVPSRPDTSPSLPFSASPPLDVPASSGAVPVRVIIEVTDTGTGIAPEEIGSVFEAFEQTRSGRYQGHGTGLGMAISRKFARLMGGDLTVTSEVGKGSTFRFSFVAGVVDSARFEGNASVQPGQVIGLKSGRPVPRVLVVDDNDANRVVLRHLLKIVGFEVREAPGGREAVTLSEEWRPAMVLMDRRMPGMDGLKAIRAIKANHWGRDTRIVIVTAGVFEGDEQECLRAGADGFIAKPYKDDEIMAVIGSLIEVDFVYEEAEAAPTEVSLRHALAQLPEDFRSALIEATESGNVSELQKLIEVHVTPQNPALGKNLRRLATNYNYETILQALSPERDDHD